ncbi:MAG TPA: ABC transporter permease [Candidatus Limnocylindrales bacterium]|nr:ABC transporter permease [Candidatus Limnocylindrales bacterium]
MLRFLRDLRTGLRRLGQDPGVTVVVILSLAIGIGANTAVFSVINTLILRPLPYPQSNRIAILWLRSPGIGIERDWPSPGQFNDVETQNHVFEEMCLSIGRSMTLTRQARPERIEALRTTSALFDLLGAKPLLGRTFSSKEDAPGEPNSVVLTYGIWKLLFGGDPQILNRALTLNGSSYSVVGVLRPEFRLTNEEFPTIGGLERIEIFLPLPLDAAARNDFQHEDYNVLARLEPGVSPAEAQADVDVISARIRDKTHRDRSFQIQVVPLQEQVVGNIRRSVIIIFGAVVLVLLIACANVANLLLARASGRRKEVAIRLALGASPWQIVKQLLAESILLGLAGGALGLLVGAASLHVARLMNPGNIPRLEELHMDARVLAFAFAISILTGIVFGLGPALRSVRVDLNTTLKSGGRDSQAGSGMHIRRDKLRALTVTAEVALSLMLLAGAGLLIRSFVRILNVPPGFNPSHLATMRISLTNPKYKEKGAAANFYGQLDEHMMALPGVTEAGSISSLPMTDSDAWAKLFVEGYTPPPNQPEMQADVRVVTPGYFQAMQMRLEEGRLFTGADTADGQLVAVVDDTFEQRFWPGGTAIGKRLRIDDEQLPWVTIVGVVNVVKQYGLDAGTRMSIYYPHTQYPTGTMYVVARTSQDPALTSREILREAQAIDPDVPAYDITTMDARVEHSLARQRFSTAMLNAFALFALILAGIGVYGVMSFLVAQGTRDIAIRIALGAGRRDILGLVFREGMGLTLAGIVAGLLGAAAMSRALASLLFGVSAFDVVTLSAVVVLLAAVALAACYFPARRALRVDPIVALRYE